MAAAVPHGQQAAQALLRQLIAAVDPGLDRQAGHHVRQGLGKLLRDQHVGGTVDQVPGLDDRPRQLARCAQIRLLPALAAGVAGHLRLPAAREGELLLIVCAIDALQGGAEPCQPQLACGGEVKQAVLNLQLLGQLGRLAVDLLAGQGRPLLPAAHGDLGGARLLELVARQQVFPRDGSRLGLDCFVVIDFQNLLLLLPGWPAVILNSITDRGALCKASGDRICGCRPGLRDAPGTFLAVLSALRPKSLTHILHFVHKQTPAFVL